MTPRGASRGEHEGGPPTWVVALVWYLVVCLVPWAAYWLLSALG